MRPVSKAILVLLVASALEVQATSPVKRIRIALATTNGVTTYAINDRAVQAEEMDRLLARLAEIDRQQSVLLEISGETTVRTFMDFIAKCRGNGFSSFRIFFVHKGRTMEISAGKETNIPPLEIIVSELGLRL